MKDFKSIPKEKVTHSIYTRVLYRDTDQMGVVYYANYLVWFEQGRTELMRHFGLPYDAIERQGILLPVSKCECNYKSSARYDDVIRIETCVADLTEVSISFSYNIYRDETGELLTTGETKHPFVSSEGKITRFGTHLLEMVEAYWSREEKDETSISPET
jgi:acyl-CoA thioester hydrolase